MRWGKIKRGRNERGAQGKNGAGAEPPSQTFQSASVSKANYQSLALQPSAVPYHFLRTKASANILALSVLMAYSCLHRLDRQHGLDRYTYAEN